MTTAFAWLLAVCAPAIAAAPERILDNFDNLAQWTVQHSDDVSAALRAVDGKAGKALGLDFNFTDAHGNPINGYATARRALPLDLPENFELSFWVRGEAPVNTFQFKLVDASGENVWWYNRPDFTFGHDWQQIRVRKRQIEFAWGPIADHTLRHVAAVEFVVSAGRDGGKGSIQVDDLVLRELPPADKAPLQPRVAATSALKDSPASAAMDGNAQTAWRSESSRGSAQQFDIDFGKPVEVGGFVLHWQYGGRATAWTHEESLDGKTWFSCGGLRERVGDDDLFTVCEGDLRYLRLKLAADEGRGYGLNEIEVKDAGRGATPNALFQDIAKRAPRGTYPRGFVEQSYWTIIGVDGGTAPALISEDGAIEPRKGGWSIEPFLVVDGVRLTWANVRSVQSLLDGYLPLPMVEWNSAKLTLQVDAFARGTRSAPQLVARYRVRNTSGTPVEATLQLAVRPFQVNPPAQFLNSPGGYSAIKNLRLDGAKFEVNDSTLWLPTPPDGFVRLAVDGTDLPQAAPRPNEPANGMYDEFGNASGALVYKLQLPADGEREIDVVAPMSAAPALPDLNGLDAAAWAQREHDAVSDTWRGRLDRVKLSLPAQARRIADTLRTAQAHMLMSRDGPALRPGTRSYARSWIRDGAMIADALLRLGDVEPVREYVDWYAPHQFANGKVPCCVDQRGSDPVPENDSHGELIHVIAQLYRYGGDRAQLEKNWPHVEAAIGYMDTLRAGETGATNPAFKGLMPASISHEGYSAKPMHSYWDDFWALTGYRDAADMAQVLGKGEAAARIGLTRDEFARDLEASIASAVQQRAIDFIPGSAELGDFDATSTTIAFTPAGVATSLPQDLLHNTFERYWRSFAARADGSAAWNDYTPYEWRTVGSFVRLGQREHAQSAIDFFFATGERPPAWNQWAEVVRRDPRQAGFVGDMPHAWVASDFVRSALDLFAYERPEDQSIVLAAGVAADWLDGSGIAIEHLHTAYGELSYRLKRTGGRIELRVAGGAAPPGGFILTWPESGTPRSASVDGKPAEWKGTELHFAAAPAEIVITN
jgi:hypothetical protein